MHFRQMFWIVAVAAMTSWTLELQATSNPLMAEADDFTIVVERLPDVLTSSSLSVRSIEQETRAFTRQNNLPVNAKSRNWLYLRISGAAIRDGDTTIGYAYNVHLYFKQNARSMNSDAMTIVSSWSSRGTSGAAQRHALDKEVRAALQDELKEFSRVWAASHGKK